ncbi:Fic family protein [Hymenobacter sp. PAMC 26628]|uniref:Fic family protein n=1 Tax=Hymenobacter sp. PAMC 26628 TaxID=1484118 RepID=UPI0007701983|nr:Fic family protein [Hymenobacter sp. PAMC 26628]AMJ66371.1 cell filamentation protein Fic [Hymenobacter sp. PAMC 26628]
MYIYQRPEWPNFTWHHAQLEPLLGPLRHQQGRVLGHMQALGFSVQAEATLQTLTLDVLKSSEIEGEMLPADQVRSSLARRLGLDAGGLVPAERRVEGVVEMLLDAMQGFAQELTAERLLGWQAALFPAGRNGLQRIETGAWRTGRRGPMQVVSGVAGRERVHFEAPAAGVVDAEMRRFLAWFNGPGALDAVLKAAVAHLWFVIIHPFEDGNGRLARAITDLQLARADATAQRFYSLSAQIRLERSAYYAQLEAAQKGGLDITGWLQWFLGCLGRALVATEQTLAKVLKKAWFWEQHAAKSLNARQLKLLNRLLDGFEGKLTSSKWATIAKCSQDTAVRDIQALVEQNILVKEAAGGRSTAYRLTL